MENNNTLVKMSPKDFFLQLGSLIILYVLFGSLVTLLFSIIDSYFADPLTRYLPSATWQMASLIVLAPLYLFLMKLVLKDYKVTPEKKNLAITKWLSYLTIFLAGAIVAGDLITVLYYFLDGRLLSPSFLTKVGVLIVLAGVVFSFYILNLRDKLSTTGYRAFAGIMLALVVGSIAFGFSVFGSPMTQRAIKFDQERVGSLQNIQYQIINYWQMKGALPTELTDLNDSLAYQNIPSDPETKEAYGYKKTSAKTFEICATFTKDSETLKNISGPYAYESYPVAKGQDNWDHPAGEHCFARSIDTDLYPTTKPVDINVSRLQ